MGFLKKREVELMSMLLRFAGGSVFLWFGIDKWVHPYNWFGWMPDWLWPLSPVSAEQTLIILGIVEFSIGLLLVMGKYVREAAILAALQLVAIIVFSGIHEIAIRDVGLLGIFLALIVEADRRSKRRIPENLLSSAGVAYVILTFVVGILYLKS